MDKQHDAVSAGVELSDEAGGGMKEAAGGIQSGLPKTEQSAQPTEAMGSGGIPEKIGESGEKRGTEKVRSEWHVKDAARIGVAAGVLGAVLAGWILRKRWHRLPRIQQEIAPCKEAALQLGGGVTGVEGWKTDLASPERGWRGLFHRAGNGLVGHGFGGSMHGRRRGFGRIFSRKEPSEVG